MLGHYRAVRTVEVVSVGLDDDASVLVGAVDRESRRAASAASVSGRGCP